MTVELLPNLEAIVSAFLRQQPEITALIGDRVYTAIPGGAVYPLVRVNQFDDVKVTQRPLRVVRGSIQIEAWGGSKVEAYLILSTAVACLSGRLEGVQPGGEVVSNVDFGGMRDVPDTNFSPAKPRWLTSAYITAHP